MASANFMKATSGKVGGMKRHLDMDERMTREHSNEDIDTSMTEQNYFVGCDSWDDMYFSWKDRTREADELHPPTRVKSDRITGCFVEIPCPWEIVNQGDEQAFFEMFLEHLKEKFGADNVHGLAVHRDEVHSYIDKDGTEKMSMIHAHALVTPYAHWKDKSGQEHEGINGKHFETRQMLHDFNDSLNERCLERFGYELNTHGLAMHKSVEQLKQEGKALRMQQKIEQAKLEVKDMKREYKSAKQELAEVQDELSHTQDELSDAQERLYDTRAEVDSLIDRESALKSKIKSLQQDMKEKNMEIRKANAIQKASQEAEIPEYKPQTFGDGLVVKTDEKTLKKAFIALSHEKDIAKREERIRQAEIKSKKDIEQMKADATKELKQDIKSLKAEKDNLMYSSHERQLKEIREDHPEIFNSLGVYQRGHSVAEMELQEPKINRGIHIR